MSLSKKAIEEFKKIYLQETGEEISDRKAQELGRNLIYFFKIIYRPVPQENSQKEKKNHVQKSNS